jgi:hypothetical protein
MTFRSEIICQYQLPDSGEADVRASPLRDNSSRWGAGDPIHQFEIIEHFPIAKIGNVEIARAVSGLADYYGVDPRYAQRRQ